MTPGRCGAALLARLVLTPICIALLPAPRAFAQPAQGIAPTAPVQTEALPAQPAPAESGPGQATPAAPAQPAPAGVTPAQASPSQTAPTQAAPPPGLPSVGVAPAPAPVPPPPAWLTRHTAVLQIVDKISATHQSVRVPVGGTTKIGTLEIEVKACVVRPPGQALDAAAYLDIVGKGTTAPMFQGWILASEPAVSIFQDSIYDIRVTGCA